MRLATADRPDVLCLQEVPVWALQRLGGWSGMQAFGAVAARPLLGSVALGRLTTALHQGLFRSAAHGAGERDPAAARAASRSARSSIVLNPPRFRRRIGARAGPRPRRLRLAWAKERRRLPRRPHRRRCRSRTCTRPAARLAPADAELLRAACFADGVAEPDDVLVLAGDFNVSASASRTLPTCCGPDWGFSQPGRGSTTCSSAAPRRGPRAVGPTSGGASTGKLLSDHAPVEVTIA